MDTSTLFVVTITTARMIMPGMPSMSNMPPGLNIPDLSAPTRTMTMDLTSDKSVDSTSTAECAIPGGLKLGPKVDLRIDLPEPGSEAQPGEDTESVPGKSTDFTMKVYWDCGEKVGAGQPRVVNTKDLAAKAGIDAKQGKFAGRMARLLTDDGSHAYWPHGDFKGMDKSAKAPGAYELTTNYCGGTSFTLGEKQDWLAAIDLTKPGKGGVDLAKAIPIEWKSVPNALAYHLTAFAGKDSEMVTWTSSSDPDAPMDIQFKAVSASDIEKYIERGILLPATATSCCIPAGIFQGYETPMLTVIAFGADKLQEKDGIQTQVIIRSTATATLGAGMGMDMDEDTGEDEEAEISRKNPADENDEEPAEEVSQDDGSGNVLDEAEEALDKADKAGNVVDRVKGIFKRR